ncbi:MAG: FISUMP domain-containing protein [Salinivirgaceae bacterium]|jgi:uncharacterized protein (TIGR02145 family)|nr:FISUMP domain-containing protein [Salinivirgaceae bacterium]
MKTKITISITSLLLSALIFYACKELDLTRQMAIKTIEVTNITTESATVKGEILDLGEGIIDHGVYYHIEPNSQNGQKLAIGNASGSGGFSVLLNNLAYGQNYYTRTYCFDGIEYIFGDEQSFVTPAKTKPEIELNIVYERADNVIVNLEIKNIGYEVDTILDYGYMMDTIELLGEESNVISYGITSQALTKDTLIMGLYPGRKYFVKAFAENKVGTIESVTQSFVVSDGLISISTSAISEIMVTSASGGGVISDDGGFDIIARGVCWGKSTKPTIDSSKTVNGSGTGSFESIFSGLIGNTIYYSRAYATNQVGTIYGGVKSFKTDLPDITGETGTLSDYDGNTYTWVGIGKQAWMAENLKVKHLPNGAEIEHVSSENSWHDNLWDTDGESYCYYNNDTTSPNGLLYTFHAANKACPIDWHLPESEEWKELEAFIGMSTTEIEEREWRGAGFGNKLKSKSGWNENGNGNDMYKYSAKPTGYRTNVGKFEGQGIQTYWWISNNWDMYSMVVRGLSSYESGLYYYGKDHNYGLSVRCLKDN